MSAQLSNTSAAGRKALVMQGMQASITAHVKAGVDLKNPTCIYGLCEAHNVSVRFNDINMEGMYDRTPKPRIHVSALRPLARRTFTCAHELGHHVFGHGSAKNQPLPVVTTLGRWKRLDFCFVLGSGQAMRLARSKT